MGVQLRNVWRNINLIEKVKEYYLCFIYVYVYLCLYLRFSGFVSTVNRFVPASGLLSYPL